MPSSTRNTKAIKICLITLSLQFTGCTKTPPGEAPPSDSFELEQIGIKSYPDAEFGIEYAFAHGFQRVDFNGASYRQISPGIILRSEQLEPPTQYKVVLDQRVPRWLPKFIYRSFTSGKLELFSKKDGRKIGGFVLPREGWPGDQAGNWLAKQLNPDPKKSQRHSYDVSKFSNITLTQPTSLLNSQELEGAGRFIKNCPSYYKFEAPPTQSSHSGLTTPNWTLLFPYSLREYRCIGQDIFIIRGHRQEDVEIIGINTSGRVFARGFVSNDKINLNLRYHHTKVIDLRFEGGLLKLRQAHFVANSPMIKPERAKYEFELSVPMSAMQIAN